jgi:hypothetical protein
MTEADIKSAIKTVEIHHEDDWWVAQLPDIGVATQARTLPELGAEIERIVVAHFAVNAEVGTDPFRCKRPSSTEDAIETLNVVLAMRTSTFAAISSSLREIERRLVATASDVVKQLTRRDISADTVKICVELAAAASAIAAVAALVETPLTDKVP